MGSPIVRMVRRTVRSGQKMVSQIVVSVAAAACVGLITNAYLTGEPVSSTTDTAAVVAPATVSTARPVRVIDGATYTTVSAGSPQRSLTSPAQAAVPEAAPADEAVAEVQWPADATVEAAVSNAPDSQRPTAAETQPPVDPAQAPVEVASLPPLQAQTIADLPIHDRGAGDAEIFPGVPAESTLAASLDAPTDLLDTPADEKPASPERRRFLGVPIPHFLPTASEFVQSASGAGGKIAALIEH